MIIRALILALCLVAVAQAQLPDAPQPQPVPPQNWEQAHGQPARLFTFRLRWTDPPLRSNKQTFKSPLFLLSQAGLVVSMVVACRNPRSGEDWGSEVPAVGAVLALDYMSERLFGEVYAVGPAVYGMVHYAQAARQ